MVLEANRKVLLSPLPQARFSTAGAQDLRKQSQELVQMGRGMEDKAANNAYMRAQGTMTQEMSRIEQQYKNQPDVMQEALYNFSSSFLEDVFDPEVRNKLELQYQTKASGSLSRAIAGRDRILTEQQQFETLESVVGIKKEAAAISKNAFNPNGVVAASAIGEIQELIGRAETIAGQVGPDGTPLLTPTQRVNAIQDVVSNISESAALSWFDGQSNKKAALDKFEKDGLVIELPNGKGGVDKINIADNLSRSSQAYIRSEVNRQAAEAKAKETAERQVRSSNLQIKIGTATTPDEIESARQELEANKELLSPSDYATKTVQIFKANQKLTEAFEIEQKVDNALQGNGAINYKEPKIKEAVNRKYQTLPLGGLSGEQVVLQKVAFADKVNHVPQAMLNEIETLSRGGIEEVVAANSLMEGLRLKAPELLSDVPQSSIEFLSDVNYNIRTGLSPEESIAVAKKNAAIPESLKNDREKIFNTRYLKEGSVDKILEQNFKGGSISNFFSDQELPLSIPDEMRLDYRREATGQFNRSGQYDAAIESTNRIILKKWGKSEVNGKLEWMRNPPERHYKVDGAPEGWIRTQLVDFMGNIPDADAQSAMMVYDPVLTELGEPKYNVQYIDKNGKTQILASDELGSTFLGVKPDITKVEIKAPEVESTREEEFDRLFKVRGE